MPPGDRQRSVRSDRSVMLGVLCTVCSLVWVACRMHVDRGEFNMHRRTFVSRLERPNETTKHVERGTDSRPTKLTTFTGKQPSRAHTLYLPAIPAQRNPILRETSREYAANSITVRSRERDSTDAETLRGQQGHRSVMVQRRFVEHDCPAGTRSTASVQRTYNVRMPPDRDRPVNRSANIRKKLGAIVQPGIAPAIVLS